MVMRSKNPNYLKEKFFFFFFICFAACILLISPPHRIALLLHWVANFPRQINKIKKKKKRKKDYLRKITPQTITHRFEYPMVTTKKKKVSL